MVEYPEGKDIERLAQHLGLVWLDRQKVGEDAAIPFPPGRTTTGGRCYAGASLLKRGRRATERTSADRTILRACSPWLSAATHCIAC